MVAGRMRGGIISKRWINYVRVRAPGCYGIQVDGQTFSEIIRFRVVDIPYDPKV
jgi:hypothetical protein